MIGSSHTYNFFFYVKWIAKNKEAFTNKLSDKLSEVYPQYTDPAEYELNKDKYTKPNEQNPLMNVLIPEIKYDPQRKSAAPAFNPDVEKEITKSVKEIIEKSFDDKNSGKKLFSELGDNFILDRSMLQFNATANTQIPNDQKGFCDFVYGNMVSGKEGHPLALERHHNGAYNYTFY